MLSTGAALAGYLASFGREHHAVQGEISVPPAVMEDVLHNLGVRMGMFRADGEYLEAFRRIYLDDGHYNDASVRVARMLNIDTLHAHAPHLIPAWNSKQIVAPRSSAPASGSPINAPPSPCSTALQAAAPVLPPFTMSWRYPAAIYESQPAASKDVQADGSHPPMDGSEGPPAATATAGAGAASTEGGLTMRPEQLPAPPRHLGMGIMVGGNPTPPIRAGPGQVDTAAETTAGLASADPAQGSRAALIGSPGLGVRAVPPHTGMRVWQQCAKVLGPRRQPAGGGADRFGGPLPTWYIRGPGSVAHDMAATAATAAADATAAASRYAYDPGIHQPQPQPQLGKRAREEGHTAVSVGSAWLGAYDFEGDDPAQLGHQRGRPRPHAVGPGVQPQLHNQQHQYLYQGTEQAAGVLTVSGVAHLAVGSPGAAHTPPGVGLPGFGAVAQGCDSFHEEVFQDVCDPAIATQPSEPAPEAAPFGELLYAVQRMGYDLCRRAQNPSWSGPGLDGSAAAWRATWVRVIIKVFDQLRRLLEARSAVSKYVAGRGPTACVSTVPTQPLASHAQLRDAVALLLLVAGELPPSKLPRAGLAPEALDAVDYLLCNSPFVDFDGCDPQARAILAEGLLRLVRLAAERGGREPGWRGVRDRALQTLVGWLVRQSEILRQLSTPSLDCTAGGQLGGLHWGPGEGLGPLPSEERLRERLVVQSGHSELLRQLAASLSVLVLRQGPSLARWLLDAEVVGALLQPQPSLGLIISNAAPAANAPRRSLASPSPSSRADALVLLHSALMALLSEASSDGCSAARLGEVCDVVLQSGLKGAAEAVLQSEGGRQSADQLLPLGLDPREAQEATACRDVVVPLLGTVYAVLLSRGALAGWAAVEGVIHIASTEGSSPASQCPLRRAWEAPADRRYRSLSLYLQAHVLRALSRMRQHHCLEAALRCELPGASAGHGPRAPNGEQLGLVGVWLRAALDCGSRPMLAALTAELICCDYTRGLLGCRPFQNGASDVAAVGAPWRCAGVAAVVAGPGGAPSNNEEQVEELSSAIALAVAADLDGSTCGRLAAALISGMVRERRLGDVRAALCGLDVTWRALRRELPRTAAAGGASTASAPGTGDAGTAPAGGGATQGLGGSLAVVASGPPAGMLRVHRAMAGVALACLEACAAGSLSGAFGASGGRRLWAEKQGPVRVLECVAEAVVDDAAALVRWEAPPTGATPGLREAHLGRWANRLRTGCSAGLLSDLMAVMARSADCHTDYSADPVQHPGEHSVLQRCLALVCLMVLELPPPGETHGPTNRLLQDHVTAAVLDHLLPTPAVVEPTLGEPGHGFRGAGYPGGSACGGDLQRGIGASGWDLGAAQANLARMLHRCIAGSIRSCIAEGLKVPVPQSAQARHAVNALSWLRSLLCHPAMRQQGLLERLLPPLLNLVVESLVTARVLLLSKDWLKYDMESATSEVPHGQVHPPRPQQQQQQVPLALIRDLLVTASRVLVAVAESRLVASKKEAYSTMPGSVRLDASPLLLMEPAPCNQLRAASGFAAALLLRSCLECFALPLENRHQKVLLSGARPPEEECSIKIRQRLATYFGNPPVLSDAERPKAVRQACGPDVLKLSAAPAVVGGADGPMKLSEAAITCIAHVVAPLEDAAYQWAEPMVEGVRRLTIEAKTGGLRYTEAQRAAVVQLLRDQRTRTARWQGRHQPQCATAPQHARSIEQMRLQQLQQQQIQEVQQQPQQEQQQQPQLQQQQNSSGGPEAAFGTGRRAELASACQATQRCLRGVSPTPMSQAGGLMQPAEDLGAASGGRSGFSAAYARHHQQAAIGNLRNEALAAVEPSSQPAAHYVAALAIQRSEDHRLRLSGCMPFADLQTLLPRGARAQADTRSACVGLPPLVGQVVEAKLRSVRSNTPVLQCTLRDASVDVAHAMIVYVVGPQEVLSMVLSDVTGRRAMVGLYGAVYLDDASASGSGTVDRGPARWPLRAKLSLDNKVTLNTAQGLVVEPRTAYTTQLRMALHAQDHRAAAPTVLAATPATQPVAASPEGQGAVGSPSQEALAVGTANRPAASGPTSRAPQYHLEKPSATIPGGGAVQSVCRPLQRDGGAPQQHALHCQESKPPGSWAAASMQIVPAATVSRIDGTNAFIEDRHKGNAVEAELPWGRIPAEGLPGPQVTAGTREGSSLTVITGDATGMRVGKDSAEEKTNSVDLAWRGMLAVSRCLPAHVGHVMPQVQRESNACAAGETTVAVKHTEGQFTGAAATTGGNHGQEGMRLDELSSVVPETQLDYHGG